MCSIQEVVILFLRQCQLYLILLYNNYICYTHNKLISRVAMETLSHWSEASAGIQTQEPLHIQGRDARQYVTEKPIQINVETYLK